MVKKVLKIVGVILLLLVVSAFAIPYFFKDQIKAKIEKPSMKKSMLKSLLLMPI